MLRTRRDKTTKRQPLDRERIVREAIALADSDGINAVSMRPLGQRLGVEAMSLYNHVASKDELFCAMVDVIIADIVLAKPGGTWRESMRCRAISMRKVFARHPWALGLLESRKSMGPASLLYCDTVLGVLRQGGFTTLKAMRAFSLLDSYAYGYAIQEKNLPSSSPTVTSQATEEFLEQLPREAYPHLAETADAVLKSGLDYAQEYEIGLDLLLEALESWREGSRAPRIGTRSRRRPGA